MPNPLQHHKCQTKNEKLHYQNVVVRMENIPESGRFVIANCLQVEDSNRSGHFKNLKDKREVFGWVIQCRTGLMNSVNLSFLYLKTRQHALATTY
jgi:hypothetical protein